MPLSALALWPEIAAREDAAAVVETVRQYGASEPIVWLTSNNYFPALRAIGSADQFYSGSFWSPSGAWCAYVETFGDALMAAGVYLGCPEWDNSLYGVDLRQWRSIDAPEDADSLSDEWERIEGNGTV